MVTPAWLNGSIGFNHRLLLRFEFTNNEQSRLLQFYIPALLRFLFDLPPLYAYMVQRWMFVFLALVVMHLYLKKWFPTSLAFAGALFLAVSMSLTFVNDLQESSPLLLVTFGLALWMIRDSHTIWYTIVLVFGALNNETMLILPLVYAVYNVTCWKPKEVLRGLGMTVLTAAPAYAATGIIRYLTRDNPPLAEWWQLPGNVQGILADVTLPPLEWWHASFLFPLFLFGILWLLAFQNLAAKPRFLRCAAVLVPIFILFHLLGGIISEARLLLPLGFVVIPLAFYSMFPEMLRTTIQSAPADMPHCGSV